MTPNIEVRLAGGVSTRTHQDMEIVTRVRAGEQGQAGLVPIASGPGHEAGTNP